MTTALRLRVQPGARRSGVVGWMADGTLKLSVSEPPEEGRANRAVEELLATMLGVRTGAVRVVRGHGARTKVVAVDGMDEGTIRTRVAAVIERDAAARPATRRGGAHDGR